MDPGAARCPAWPCRARHALGGADGRGAARHLVARTDGGRAGDLGAGPVAAFRLVTLPWLGRTLAGPGLLAALNSFDDFIRSFLLGGYEPTLSVLIFGRLRSGLTPEINALATLTLLATIAIGAALAGLMRARG